MKKIININLSGRVIPIEDSAYEKLQAYIESLRRYFANEESRDEIINDIESRIAELLHEKIRKGAETTTDADINEIIASMGTIEDFEAAEKENIASSTTASSSNQGQNQEQQQQQYTSTKQTSRGRLYRDSNDKFIGGVCSGIASYLNVDSAVIRLLFAILGFATGVGFLAYIILWIILPPKDLEGYTGKRLYRNPDNRVLGGVAGGLAAYFGKSATWIRVIFAAPILLNIFIRILNRLTWDNDFDFAFNIGFGSLTGLFIITYIILWIVLPEASSDYQKMEMRGEKVDVNRIRQNVKEGMSNMKDRMKDWGEEVKATAENIGAKGKEMGAEFRESSRRKGSGIGHAIGVIFKAFFLFIAGTIAFSLFVALIALIFGGAAWWPINNFLWTSKWQQFFAWATLILFFVVPLVGFVTWVIRRIIRAKSRNNYLGWTFGGLWAMGWVVMIFFVTSMIKDFRHEGTAEPITVAVTQPANGKMIVAVTEPGLEYSGGFGWMNDECDGWDISKDTLKIAAIKVSVYASADDQYHAQLVKRSFGRTKEEAIDRAERIQYRVVSRDSLLDLGNGYAIDKQSKFRIQNVELEIYVPVGKKIRFDESVKRKLNSLNVKVKRKNGNAITGLEIKADEEDFPFRTNIDYTMSAGGTLVGPDGKPETTTTSSSNNGYKYEEKDSLPKNKEQSELEQLRKQNEEKDKRIKELEKNQQKPNGIIKKTQTDNAENVAAGPSPVSSLVQYF